MSGRNFFNHINIHTQYHQYVLILIFTMTNPRCNVFSFLNSNIGIDMTLTNNDGDTAYAMSIKRQAKLNDPELQSRKLSKLDRESLLKEGLDIIKILKGVQTLGSYHEFAKHHPMHELVGEFSPWSVHMHNRVQLTLLRNLVIDERATQLTVEELQEKRAREKEQQEEEEKEKERGANNESKMKEKVLPTLEEAMKKDGVHDYYIGLKAMDCVDFKGLKNITREMMSRNGNLDAKERRACWMWIKKQQDEVLGGLQSEMELEKQKIRDDPTINMSKTQKKKYIKKIKEIENDEKNRRIGLNIAFRVKFPDDAFRFMMGYLY